MKRVLSSMIIIALSAQIAWLHADAGSRKNNFNEPAGLSQMIKGLKEMPAEQAKPILISMLKGIDSTDAIHDRFGDSVRSTIDATYIYGCAHGNYYRFWGYKYDWRLAVSCWEYMRAHESWTRLPADSCPVFVRGFQDAYLWGTPVPVLN